PPSRTPVMNLAEIVGSSQSDAIKASGQIVFHAAGDTGAGKHSDLGDVVNIMVMDFHRPNPADHPTFFFHLGDVTYNEQFGVSQDKSQLYPGQFYDPYSDYPAKILAIPGNHDSNPEEDRNSLQVFQDNFCAPLPTTEAGVSSLTSSSKRTPMFQPGVFF